MTAFDLNIVLKGSQMGLCFLHTDFEQAEKPRLKKNKSSQIRPDLIAWRITEVSGKTTFTQSQWYSSCNTEPTWSSIRVQPSTIYLWGKHAHYQYNVLVKACLTIFQLTALFPIKLCTSPILQQLGHLASIDSFLQMMKINHLQWIKVYFFSLRHKVNI